MVTYYNYAYYGDHFEMYRNIESLCCAPGNNTVVQLCFENIFIEKEIRFLVTTGGGWGQGELDEGSQKVQTFSYKINNKL